jgi:mono/diheme cytochrome c family protein
MLDAYDTFGRAETRSDVCDFVRRRCAMNKTNHRVSSALAAALAVGSVALIVPPAAAAGDAARGHALARTWCANCHSVEANGPAKDAVPSFGSIAARGAPEQLRARAFLNAPHPPMPDFNLSRSQTDDIVAYLQSLAENRPRQGNRPP